MHLKGESLSGYLLSRWDIGVVVLSISLALFLVGACTKDEQSEVQRPKVVVRMGIPPQEKSFAPEKAESEPEKTAPEVTETLPPEEEKPSPPPPPAEQQQALRQTGELEKMAPDVTGIETIEIKKLRLPQLTEQPEEIKAENEPEIKPPEAAKTGIHDEKLPGPPPLPQEQQEEPIEKKAEEGIYRVRKGDSLYSIAGREDVYGDPIKWPSLFRLNMKQLGEVNEQKGFRRGDLPEGIDLKFVTPSKIKENLTKLGPKFWVINVLSSRTPEKLLPLAIKLIKNGYHVYIINAEIRGEEWMRLRVGFFEDRPEAAVAGQEIMSLLNSRKPWIVKIEQRELGQFGGY